MINNKTSPPPLLSICIPAYNRPKLIQRTLNSIEPKNREIEIIICDNSTNDETKEVVQKSLKNETCTWKYFKNNPSISPTENHNKCIKLARGRYIYIIHDDDYLLPGGLQLILKHLQASKHKVIMFGIKTVTITEET
ncbi:glycosyltransferase family 2 protein [Xanthovirga aplysinae]|uniref:glycosyltransferase family 2 protein n=1 Tax=Xanthovirga aplysinae TaxID=2529853 RepID=UPI0012BC37FB|nr:glycosyltransferase family A protein [Xanthovirga aplysinae]MTI30628.1 glycosyltransferase family 2 protein [Xanthovirga aplysinae]